MNFLEGLKRLFIVFAALVMIASVALGWSAVEQPYGCIHLDEVQWDAPGAKSPKTLSYQEALPATGKFVPVVTCLKPMEYWPKKIGFVLGSVVLAAAILLAFWHTLRWIILGFWPGAARKP